MSPAQTPDNLKSFIRLTSAALFLIGLGYLAILPPFEGTDELHHYSGIRQVADGREIPVIDRADISPDVIDYQQHGPMPYGIPITHKTGEVKFGGDQIITYPDFFSNPAMIADYKRRYRSAAPRVPYVPKTEQYNWEAQHPPLYSVVMAPVMKASDPLSFSGQIFVLRLASFALAMAGLLIGMRATFKFAGQDIPPSFAAVGFLLYPIFFPAFFTEFGRLGQDSLCLFLFGIAWYFVLRWRQDMANKKTATALGICFGFGLLAKALFLPIIAGFVLYAFHKIWSERNKALRRSSIMNLAWIVLFAVLIGGGWYIYQYQHYGSFSGDLALIKLQQQGGVLANLRAHFVPLNFAAAIYGMMMTWLLPSTISAPYTGTWLDGVAYILVFWIMLNYVRARKNSVAYLPLWFVLLFLAALVWHLLIFSLKPGNGVGGWYLHVLAPAGAVMIAYAAQRIAQSRAKRIVFFGLLGFSVILLAVTFWSQASLFAGCAIRNEAEIYLKFSDSYYCFDHLRDIASHLAVIGFPWIAAVGFGGGFFCLVAGLFQMRNLLTS